MGRHTAKTTTSVPLARVVAVIVALGVCGTGVVWGISRVTAGASANPASGTKVAASVRPTVTTSAGAATDGSTELAACQAQVAAGHALAAAAADSARDWRQHVSAQWELDSGTIVMEDAEKHWAESKARAEADLKQFARAATNYKASGTTCSEVTEATANTDKAATAVACAARATALAAIARTGTVVNQQWSDHVDQMRTKATAAGPGYHDEWMHFVDEARTALAAYDETVVALESAPTC